MIRYTLEAEQQIDDLRIHYEKKERLEAARNLDRALEEAEEQIIANPGAGLPTPRPYPRLKRRSVKAGGPGVDQGRALLDSLQRHDTASDRWRILRTGEHSAPFLNF